MASLRTQRLGASISWTLQYTIRSRLLTLSLSSAERTPHRHRSRSHAHSSSSNPSHRDFSTHTPWLQQSAPSSGTPSRAKPPPPTSRTTGKSESAASTGASREPPPPTSRTVESDPPREPLRDVTQTGLSDMPNSPSGEQVDWTTSFQGLSSEAFSKETADILLQPLNSDDIEIKPDGIVFLPEIKYRRILNRAFGPGGWGLAPRGETIVTAKCVTREYALLANGRLVSIARGEQDYFDGDGVPTATEGCKSNALMRCCKDLGIASELWDPRFIRKFMQRYSKEVWVEHVVNKRRRKIVMRKDDEPRYPYKETKMSGASGAF